ncbi:unnamed protein product [Miscanthus lutarioriparius]|uniref:MPV17 n=1 Tax=Miscanthus lutarioriparius TaxID=422564 RepID=A0A811NZ57_9POAL|nr:unnamed protein product [Miscanthus lutarioriparius]
MRRLWRCYQQCLATHPVRTQVVSSGILWGLGDIGAQAVTHYSTRPDCRGHASSPPEVAAATAPIGHPITAPFPGCARARCLGRGETDARRVKTQWRPEAATGGGRTAASPWRPSSPTDWRRRRLRPNTDFCGAVSDNLYETDSPLVTIRQTWDRRSESSVMSDVTPFGVVLEPLFCDLRGDKDNKDNKDFKVDWRRVGITSSFGFAFVGPVGHYWYEYLDRFIRRRFQPNTFKFVASKVAADGFLFGPLDLLLFFSYVGLGQGRSVEQVKEDVKRDFIPALVLGGTIWPAVQIANFRFIPVRYQLLYVNLFCLLDSCFLSWIEQQGDASWKRWFTSFQKIEDQKSKVQVKQSFNRENTCRGVQSKHLPRANLIA